MSADKLVIYEFGPFHLYAARRKLFKNRKRHIISRQLLDCLLLLIDSHPFPMRKTELFGVLWPNHMGTPEALDVRLKDVFARLRHALADEDLPSSQIVESRQDLAWFMPEVKVHPDDPSESETQAESRLADSIRRTASGSATPEPEMRPLTRLLQLYYPDHDLKSQNLFRYAYKIDGRQITTNMATSNAWMGLALPITETASGRYLIEERTFWPTVPDSVVEQLRAELTAKGVLFRNRPIYSLLSFTPREYHIAAFSVAQYVDYKLNLGMLEEETINALAASVFSPELAFDERESKMPLREKLLPNSRVMADYGVRLCAGGTNVLLAFRTPDRDDYMFYIKRRSNKVSTGRKAFALMPSGMHQPTIRSVATGEASIGATVYRELDEEIFGAAEPDEHQTDIQPLEFMSKPHLDWFSQHPDQYTLEVVSFGLNLMDGTYEFQVLLVVNDETYLEQFPTAVEKSEEFDDTITSPFFTRETARLASIMTDRTCADTSLIALVEGLRRLEQLEPKRVSLPRIEIR